ncbi:MAG: hypothetical protein ACQET7_02270 [Thermodesulfobacteriota bacterium]
MTPLFVSGVRGQGSGVGCRVWVGRIIQIEIGIGIGIGIEIGIGIGIEFLSFVKRRIIT